MKDLILSNENTMEENILAIINFVKQVEKEYGLTDEQIIFKYTCGNCFTLAYEFVCKTLEKLFGEIKGLSCVTLIPKTDYIDIHRYVKLEKPNCKKELYFDILGKKTKKEVKSFLNGNFWDKFENQPWVKNFYISVAMEDTYYVKWECERHIKVDGLTIY